MLRYIGWFALVGVLVPVGAFLLSVVVPLFPSVLIRAVLSFCPSYLLFIATAACEPFDACSLSTLAQVVSVNVILYVVIGGAFWYTRTTYRAARLLVGAAVLAGWVWIWTVLV
jgi:hypothetical protein